MPKGIFDHPKQCGFQKGHPNFLTTESIKRRSETRKDRNPNRGQSKQCEMCHKIFYRTPNDRDRLWNKRKFCSLRCNGMNHKGNRHSEERKDNMSAIMMGNTRDFVVGKPSLRKGKKSDKPAWNKGMKMPQKYGKDRTPRQEKHRLRTSAESIMWRKEVFSRDDYTCQKYKIKGGKLHPHHLYNFADYPELRFDITNGITLSYKAHREFHHKYGVKNNTKKQLDEFLKN